MAKRDADPIQAANAAWREAMRDETYRDWWMSRLRELIRITEFPDRVEELRKILEDIDQKGGGDGQ